MKIKIEAGTCWPDEYDWQTQFAEALNGQYDTVDLDVGKVRGLALAYLKLLDTVKGVGTERASLLKELGAVIVDNQALIKELAELKQLPPQLKVGDRVLANNTAGFNQGATGVIQFIEPSGEKVWVLRDHSTSPVYYHPDELDIIEEEIKDESK